MTTQTQPADEQRLSRLEGAYEQMNERFGELARSQEAFRAEVNGRFDALRSDMDARFDALRSDMDARIDALRSDMDAGFGKLRSEMSDGMKELRSDVNTRINVTMVLIGGVWVTLAAGLIAIFTQT